MRWAHFGVGAVSRKFVLGNGRVVGGHLVVGYSVRTCLENGAEEKAYLRWAHVGVGAVSRKFVLGDGRVVGGHLVVGYSVRTLCGENGAEENSYVGSD